MKTGRIPVSEGQRISEKYDAPIVIMFTVLDGGDTFNVMSYGKNKALCEHAAKLAREIGEKVLSGEVEP